MKFAALLSSALAAASVPVPHQVRPEIIGSPFVAAHQHLISPAFASEVLKRHAVEDGASLLRKMDEAGMRRGVVLSMGYSFGDERKNLSDPDHQTSDENTWTSSQVTQSRGRLVGFCGVNPLRSSAIAEIKRCLRLPGMVGIKLHLGNSGITLQNPEHLAKVQQIFKLANTRRAAIVVHLRTRSDKPYSPDEARLFLAKLLPFAPNAVVQVAHLAGAGPGFAKDAQAAFDVFATAIEHRDPRTNGLYFDECSVPSLESTPEEGIKIAEAIRRVGVQRVLFGSDMSVSGNPELKESWEIFKAKVPLTAAEFQVIARNVPPYWPR